MKKLDLGFIQGRLTKPPSKNILQYFPQENWKKEFFNAKKNNFQYIEYFVERKFNKRNPFWSLKGLKQINLLAKNNNLINYSLCDDYFINHSFIKYRNFTKYTDTIVKNLSLLKIKIYVLALFEKSELKKNNLKKFVYNIKYLSERLKEKKIKLALETNLENKYIKDLIYLVNNKNLFIVYDTGNRLKKGNLQYKEIIELKNYICHVHLKDKNLKKQNVLLGSGKVDFRKIFKALKKIKYKGKYTFETNRGDLPIETMKNNRKIIININEKLSR